MRRSGALAVADHSAIRAVLNDDMEALRALMPTRKPSEAAAVIIFLANEVCTLTEIEAERLGITADEYLDARLAYHMEQLEDGS